MACRLALIEAVVKAVKPSPAGAICLICGPPVMFRFVIRELDKVGIPRHNVFVDLERRTATRDTAPLHLTPIEFRLLAALARHLGMVVTHRQLLAEVWGPSHTGDTHYLRIYVKQLRDKLEPDPLRPRHLVTEIGVGYRLVCAD